MHFLEGGAYFNVDIWGPALIRRNTVLSRAQYELCHRRFSRNFQKNFQKSFFKDHRWDASDFVWLFLKNVQNTF